MRRNTFALFAISLGLLTFAYGCGPSDSADSKDRATADLQQDQYTKAQPVPTFNFSLERDVYIQLYQARNKNVATHTIWRSDLCKVLGDCPSIGYPIPFDSSLTNPVKIGRRSFAGTGGHYDVIEQAEPNGLYSSKNSVATWIRCILADGTQVPVYVEDKVTAFPYPVEVNYETDRVVQAGTATVTLSAASPATATQ